MQLASEGFSRREIADRIGVKNVVTVSKLMRKECSIPGPGTEAYREVECLKLDRRERFAASMLQSNVTTEERPMLDASGKPMVDAQGKPVTRWAQVIPPQVQSAYDAAMNRIAARRAALLGIDAPAQVEVTEKDAVVALLARAEAALPEDEYARLLRIYATGELPRQGDTPAGEEGAREAGAQAAPGGAQSH